MVVGSGDGSSPSPILIRELRLLEETWEVAGTVENP